jgi:hypothetical protein
MIDKHGTVWVDNTTLRSIASCETQAALKHALDKTVAEEKHQLEVGIAAHEILADHMRGKPRDYCLKRFELLYRGYSEDNGLDRPDSKDSPNPMYRMSWKNTSAILGEWLELNPLSGFPFLVKPKMVEVAFQLPLDDECVCGHWEGEHRSGGCRYRAQCQCLEYHPRFVFWGRMDAIVQANHDNALYVFDHKTTGRLTPWKVDSFRMDSQMSGYTWAAQQSLGQKIAGIFVNAIEFSKLPSDPIRTCKVHGGVPYAECGPLHMKSELMIFTRSDEQLARWHKNATQLAWQYRNMLKRVKSLDDLTSVAQEGTFHGACSFCDFKPFCQDEQKVPGMLIEHVWRPPSQQGGE